MSTGDWPSYGLHIDERKLTGYLLSDSHPAGRAKATFFRRFGFDSGAVLEDALYDHARTAEVAAVLETEFGSKYVLRGPLRTPQGRTCMLCAVWFVATGEVTARLVTAYPKQGGEG